jgi:hypothetical protein
VKNWAAALLVVFAVTLRFAGGEMSRSAVFDRFKGFVDILAIFEIEYSCRWSLTGNPSVLIIRLIDSGVVFVGEDVEARGARSTGARGHVPSKVQFGLSLTTKRDHMNMEDKMILQVTPPSAEEGANPLLQQHPKTMTLDRQLTVLLHQGRESHSFKRQTRSHGVHHIAQF